MTTTRSRRDSRRVHDPGTAGGVRIWFRELWCEWDRFWFTPSDAATLGVIRICAGAMLFYTHLVWTLEPAGFFGTSGWLSADFVHRYYDSPAAWSHLFLTDNGFALLLMHAVALLVFFALMIGFWTRVTSVLSFLLAVSYAHRGGGAMFGLDQINIMLALYLSVGASGGTYSVDQWLRCRRQPGEGDGATSCVSTNVAIRLIQIHMCVIYLFAGLSKLRGDSWWDGTAAWGAFANYEYQTLDLARTMARSALLVNVLTHATVVWEVSYAAIIWPKRTRPLVLAAALPIHLGIAFCMGMITFGLIMIVGNFAFLPTSWVRSVVDRGLLRRGVSAANASVVRRPQAASRTRDQVISP